MPISCNRSGYIGTIAYARDAVKLEGEPFSQVVELSGENGERLSLTGENLLEAEARAKALEKENAVLRERVEHVKNQLRQTEVPTVDRAQVRKQARALAKRYQATVTVDELSARLQDLYDRMTQEKHMSWEVAYQEAKTIARDLAESAVTLNDGLYQEYAELRSYLKKTPLRISEEESHDIPDYNSWRKHYLGKVRIGKGKTNVDQVYQELSQMWPELFPQEGTEAAPVAPSDQLLHIAQVVGDLYSVTEENPYSGQMEQITAEIANDVMASFFEVPQAKKTFADRQQAKLEAEIAKGRGGGAGGPAAGDQEDPGQILGPAPRGSGEPDSGGAAGADPAAHTEALPEAAEADGQAAHPGGDALCRGGCPRQHQSDQRLRDQPGHREAEEGGRGRPREDDGEVAGAQARL